MRLPFTKGAREDIPHRLHLFRNRGASGDYPTRCRNLCHLCHLCHLCREPRSPGSRSQILKHYPLKTGILMTLSLLIRWVLYRQSMCISRKPLPDFWRQVIMMILMVSQGKDCTKLTIFHRRLR